MADPSNMSPLRSIFAGSHIKSTMLTKLTVLTAVVALAYAGLDIEARLKQVGSFVDQKTQSKFSEFKQKYGKTYETEDEEKLRLGAFVESLKFIEEHNAKYAAGEKTHWVGINQFADKYDNEYVNCYFLNNDMDNGTTYLPPSNQGALPDSVDWNSQGYVTPVKNQHHCGACWAFAAAGALEGQNKKKTGNLVELSTQNLVDCSNGQWQNQGCNGGDAYAAFNYVKDNNGIDSDESYPYTGQQRHQCEYDAGNKAASATGATKIPATEARLQEAVANIGPIAACMDAQHSSFRLYEGGIYSESYCHASWLNHAVLVTGYGSENGKDYWTVKNVWGTDWGEQGFARLSRNNNNNCGIASRASYPLV